MAYGRKYYPKQGDAPKKKWNPNWGKKQAVIVPGSMYKPVLNLSSEQIAIRDEVVNGNGNVLITARAGCSKTTVCVESMYAMRLKHPTTSQGYIVFNRKNRIEAESKCPPGTGCFTAHSFGMRALGAAFGKITVDNDKTNRIATALVGPDDEAAELRYMLVRGIDLGKSYLATTTEEVISIIEKHNIETCALSEVEFADKVLEGMKVSLQQPTIVSYSDMLYCAVKLGIRIPSFDILYADELQDNSPINSELIFRSLGSRGRLVGVGDDKQSIYGFTGADRHALAKIQERANAVTLGLKTTFRCAKRIVEFARKLVPDYMAAEQNPEGEVCELSTEEMMSEENGVMPGDFILSRTNAPIAKFAMQLLKQGRKCNIQGKDIGQGLLFMIKRSGANSVAGFQSWLEEWASAEIERLAAKRKDHEHIIDKKECLEHFCEGQRDLAKVKADIKAMFNDSDDESDRVQLSSIHRAKGLERNRVYILESSFTCRPKNEEEQEQETNIKYVGYTRPRNSLFLVS
jgi:DNA helicase-2/ATP-dependent DNA helicase PcrA